MKNKVKSNINKLNSISFACVFPPPWKLRCTTWNRSTVMSEKMWWNPLKLTADDKGGLSNVRWSIFLWKEMVSGQHLYFYHCQPVGCPTAMGFDHGVVKIIRNERAEYPSEWTPDVAIGIVAHQLGGLLNGGELPLRWFLLWHFFVRNGKSKIGCT